MYLAFHSSAVSWRAVVSPATVLTEGLGRLQPRLLFKFVEAAACSIPIISSHVVYTVAVIRSKLSDGFVGTRGR